MELYLHSPNMSSWRGAHLKHRDNFTFTFYLIILDSNSNSLTDVKSGLLDGYNREAETGHFLA
jgi:hypothetical protein